jgi:hypothetical protein
MPQPIDPFTELGRVLAAERIQQIADRASLAAQQRVQADQERELLRAEQQVRQSEQKSEEVERELRRRNPFAGRRQRKPPEPHTAPRAPSGDDEEDGPDTHHFDVSV